MNINKKGEISDIISLYIAIIMAAVFLYTLAYGTFNKVGEMERVRESLTRIENDLAGMAHRVEALENNQINYTK